MTKRAVLLVSHGTVDDLDDLPAFVTNIRRGHAPPPELVDELRTRYQAIGGQSPLNAINADVARALEAHLARFGVAVRAANRLWRPYPRDVLAGLAGEGITRIAAIPLAQHSARVYADSVRAAAASIEREGGPRLDVACAADWGQTPELVDAFAARARAALLAIPEGERRATALVVSAHSLPAAAIAEGDAYERELRASADAIFARLGADCPAHRAIAFQSQGMSTGPGGRKVEWLGPDLPATFRALRDAGATRVVILPAGFLADHVEILYDLDVEARALAEAIGMTLTRTASLNASPDLVAALAAVARPLLAELGGGA